MKNCKPIDTKMQWPELVATHASFVRQCANKLTYNWADAQDLAQDTLIKALENEIPQDASMNLKGWLRQVCYSIFVNNYRKRAKFQKIGIDVAGLNDDYAILGTCIGEGQFTQDANQIKAAIRLAGKPIDAEVVRLRMEGYKYKEIAELTNLNINSVKTKIRHGRVKLMGYKLFIEYAQQ